jgi:hypothetical protein
VRRFRAVLVVTFLSAAVLSTPGRAVAVPHEEFPTGVLPDAGTILSGDETSLAADDDQFLVVRSAKPNFGFASAIVLFGGIPNDSNSIRFTYRGRSSVPCTLEFALAEGGTNGAPYVPFDSLPIGTSEVEVETLSPPGPPSQWISNPPGFLGTIRLRVRCTTGGSSAFDLSSDLAMLTVDHDEELPEHTLTVTKDGTGSGTVASSGGAIDCGSVCSRDFIEGTAVGLQATPDPGSAFVGWSSSCEVLANNFCRVEMTADATVTATFDLAGGSGVQVPASFTVETGIYLSGTAGSLASDDDTYLNIVSTKSGQPKVLSWYGTFAAIDRGATSLAVSYQSRNGPGCTQVISIFRWTDSTWVELDTRVADDPVDISGLVPPGSPADYVSGTDPTGDVRVRQFCSLSGNQFQIGSELLNLTVTGASVGHTLTVGTSGAGAGTVTSSPAGIDCGPDCTESYAEGTLVTLSATPDASSTFAGWSGACAGTGACEVAMTADASVTAAFDVAPPTQLVPSAFTVTTGTLQIGTIASLAADDGDLLAVRSTKTGTRTATWFGSFTGVDDGVASIGVNSAGSASATCTQVVSIFRWTDSTWVDLDTRSVGPTEVALAGLAPPGVPGDYVSGTSGPGEVRVRISCSTATVVFTHSQDLLALTV